MIDPEPVHLTEDGDNGGRFLIYGGVNGPQIELRYEGDALWMTQAQMAALFGRDISVISRHISAVLDEGELGENHLQKMQMNPRGGPSNFYSLDMVISVGYRVSSTQATLFRRWATDKLVQFATKGFVIDTVRLKQPDARDRVAELRDIIRDIRSDEANVYREMRLICSMCLDYEASSQAWQTFYQTTQAKLVYAVSSSTPAEIIKSRANADHPNMGLLSWSHDKIRKSDVSTSKNYLGQSEVKELNRLTEILLGIFEDQMDIGRLKTMAEATILLDKNLKGLGRGVLNHGGQVKAIEARAHAEREYERFKSKLKAERHLEAERAIEEVRQTLKRLRKSKD